ncbi:MAG TPA: hypothetical protein VLS51_08570 [Propionibacteriaceae bacterium]|nr:hypothetical protein [Propionibacteriaceae bacterium]
MTQAPDRFPTPYRTTYGTDERPTPPGMGGAAPRFAPSRVPIGGGGPTDRGQAAAMRAAQDRLTRAVPIQASGTVPASGPLVLDAGGPDAGYVWDLKRLMVGPVDYTALPYATGVTVLAFLRGQGDTHGNSATHMLSWTKAWPAQGTWGRHEAHLEHGDRVQVVVLGLAAGTVVTVGGSVEQTASDVALVWGE